VSVGDWADFSSTQLPTMLICSFKIPTSVQFIYAWSEPKNFAPSGDVVQFPIKVPSGSNRNIHRVGIRFGFYNRHGSYSRLCFQPDFVFHNLP